MVQTRAWLHNEPTVDELMADPIVHLLMRSDGIQPEDVWQTIRTVSAHLREQRQYLATAA